jgi:hypothetical protein
MRADPGRKFKNAIHLDVTVGAGNATGKNRFWAAPMVPLLLPDAITLPASVARHE